MIPTANDLMSPEMQRIALFLVPVFIAIVTLVLNLSRGFSTLGAVTFVLSIVLALYFAADFMELF